MPTCHHIILSHASDPSKQSSLPFPKHRKLFISVPCSITFSGIRLSPQFANLNLTPSARPHFNTTLLPISSHPSGFLSPFHSSSILSVAYAYVDIYFVTLLDIIFICKYNYMPGFLAQTLDGLKTKSVFYSSLSPPVSTKGLPLGTSERDLRFFKNQLHESYSINRVSL